MVHQEDAEDCEMAQSVRCLLRKREVLLGTYVSPGTVPMIPVLEEIQTGESL